MKDIFIDANIANHFIGLVKVNPHYQNLINWLLTMDEDNPDNNAYLVISNELRNEYNRAGNCTHELSIVFIMDKMLRQGRINPISNSDIKNFCRSCMTKRVRNSFTSDDQHHIPVVLLSNRKMILSDDTNFISDLLNFPKLGNSVIAARRPENLKYK